MAITVTGAEGQVYWAYHRAATLRAWTITHTDGAGILTGTLASHNDFAVSQRPLKFVASNGWTWPIESLQIMGASCTATLGPKESRYVPASETA